MTKRKGILDVEMDVKGLLDGLTVTTKYLHLDVDEVANNLRSYLEDNDND